MRAASSSPLTTVTRSPVERSSAAAKSEPLAASRTALVATIDTRSAPARRARAAYSPTTAAVRWAGASPSRPVAASPSPSRVTR